MPVSMLQVACPLLAFFPDLWSIDRLIAIRFAFYSSNHKSKI